MIWQLTFLQKAGTFILVLIAFLSLWTGGALPLPVGLLCLILGTVGWFWEPPRIRFQDYESIWRPLTLGVVGILLIAALFGYLGLFDFLLGIVLYLTGAKLFQRERAADYIQTTVLSFLLMSIATLFNESFTFGFLFILYVLVGLLCLTFYHLRIQAEQYPEMAQATQNLSQGFLGLLLGLGGIALVSSLLFFFLFPRIGFGILGRQSQVGVTKIGFSEEMNLGSFGLLKSDPTVIMRVEFPDGPPPNPSRLYWRGISYDTYNGKSWLRTLTQSVNLQTSPGETIIRIPELLLGSQKPQDLTLEQLIYREPLDTQAVFSLFPPLSVDFFPTQSNAAPRQPLGLRVSKTGDLSYPFSQTSKQQYRVISSQPRWTAEELTTVSHEAILAALDPEQQVAYLQLPENLDPRIPTLAQDIIQGRSSDLEKIVAIRKYLLDNYSYTIDLPDPGQTPPLDAFLFQFRRGHCEYFSTAMAVLLRSIGIPSRSVSGFIGGRWNDQEGYLIVRQADAHSWIEVPFGAYGWILFDPTPPAANVSNQRSWLDPIRSFYDTLQFRWMKYVIQYDLKTQLALWQQATTGLDQLLRQPNSSSNQSLNLQSFLRQLRQATQQNWIPLLALGGSVILAAQLGWQSRRPSRQEILWISLLSTISGSLVVLLWQPTPSSILILLAVVLPGVSFAGSRWYALLGQKEDLQGISLFYQELRTSLAEVNICILPHEGPEALLLQLEHSNLTQKDHVRGWIQRYMQVRFGQYPLQKGELRQLRQSLLSLKKTWIRDQHLSSR
jgi:transglutaminase-like putative cysteine protease